MSEFGLPESWVECDLDEILDYVTSGSRDWSRFYAENGANFIRTQDINKNELNLSSVAKVALPEKVEGKRTLVKKDDLLITITGANVGKCAAVKNEIPESYVSQSVALVRLLLPSMCDFMHRQIVSPVGDQTALQKAAYGMGRPVLNLSNIREFKVKLPCLAEQQQIAQKLDELLAQVDTLKTRLDAIPKILKRFRQSVLAAAVSGRLTEAWRVTKRLDDWKEVCIKDVGNVQLGRQRSPKYHSGENMKPYLRVQNVFEDFIDTSDVMEMEFSAADFERYKLHSGDILLNEGQSPKFLGRPAIFRNEIPDACFTNTLIRFQAGKLTSSEYAFLVFRNHMHSGRYIDAGTITTNIAHLGAGRFGNIEFPLPPVEEQTEIVRRVEQLFAYADQIEQHVKDAQARVNHLTQSILAKAFRGELTAEWRAQNPELISGENSAAALLERIKVEREVAVKSKRKIKV